MSTDDKQPFLSRWSRRKLESVKPVAEPKPAASDPPANAPVPGAPAGSPPGPKQELPPIDSLRGLASEYRDFLHPGVDEKLRHAALGKLFRDPHFNVIDLMDVYIDDYTKPDPIPEAMLRTLTHAKELLFGDEKEDTAAKAGEQGDKPALAAEELPAEQRESAASRSQAANPGPEPDPQVAPAPGGTSKA